MKLSFIIPIFGVEQYLCKCIDSLLNQNYDDYEIILVDDGSKDSCPAMCDDYAARYDNIRVVHRENGGLSAARNSGIQVAKGEYVCFVDSDDYWEENVLSGLMAQIERDHLDVLRFQYRNVGENKKLVSQIPNPWGPIDYSARISSGKAFLNERLGYACYAWAFIVRCSLLADCLFSEGLLFEDTDWTPRMLVRAGRVSDSDLLAYNYLIRQGSISQSIGYERMMREVVHKVRIIQSLQNDDFRAGNASDWYDGMIACLVISILKICSGSLYKERKNILELLRQNKVFPLHPYHFRAKTLRNIHFININPSLFVTIKHILYLYRSR